MPKRPPLKVRKLRPRKPEKAAKPGEPVETDRRVDVFLPDKLQLVRMIAMRGASDDEIADTFGVSRQTFAKWRRAYPTMEKALEEGRMQVDADVVESLYRQAVGYTYEEDAPTKTGVVRLERYRIPDVGAIKYWLDNRQPSHWKSSQTTRVVGSKNPDGSDAPIGVKVETRNDIIDAILGLIPSKPDGINKPKAAAGDRVKR